MKNISTLLGLFLLTACPFNNGNSQVRLGLKTGLNLANLNADEELDIDTKILPALMIGGIVAIPLSEKFGILTGVEYQGKGAINREEDDVKAILNYIQIPLGIQFKNRHLFCSVGPYVAYAFSGKNVNGSDSYKYSFGSTEDDDFSQFDYGGNIELGYEFGDHVRVSASYSLGLANGVPKDQREDYDGASAENTVIGFAISYLFSKKQTE
ncbi:MAG: PorT family protein [Saprospiraceae bacterium]|uniref:PorT family protein n=1 Tax=Candidatus Opimibacter skivensis TaxID=2982028 RepID=A0A9D7SXW1_9BACT|nr:PorT family protein [Candidatus Opimibacter skivensis]